ncbi:MAG: hypothetical protein JWR21_1807 [Herminiimonas sp.]|nr:hypothetical protein [Herminiimonas sp.]
MELAAILEHVAIQREQEFNVGMQMRRERGTWPKADQLHGSPVGFRKAPLLR